MLIGMLLTHGALQSSVEQNDPLAPALMTAVAIPIYGKTTMLAMSQLGMMFAHGNSPGAAFSLLLLGTGMKHRHAVLDREGNYGIRPSFIWFSSLTLIVLACAYAVDRPLIPLESNQPVTRTPSISTPNPFPANHCGQRWRFT